MSTQLERFTPLQPLGPRTLLVRAADGTPRVLKRLGDGEMAEPAARLRFQQEAWRAAQLDHPRFARASFEGALDAQLYYTMPYAQGPAATLVSPDDVAQALREVAEGLCWLHRQGWVHAALEPTALRRTEAGLVIVRYGALTPIGQAAFAAGAAAANPYLAPEQRAGRPLDGRADLYALGALLGFWLTGEGASGEAERLLVASPHPLAPIARRLLAPAPADRFRDAGELLAALAAPVPAGPLPKLVGAPVSRPALELPLAEWFDGLAAGRGGARTLIAPVGLGKTTLLETAAAQARARGLAVVRLGPGDAAALPLSPWLALTTQLWQLAAERSSALCERLRVRLGALDGLEGADPLARIVAGDGGMQRYLDGLYELVAAVAPPGLLVVVDDWEQADEASREVLAELVRRTVRHPVGWLVAGEGALDLEVPGWTLPPLTRDESLALVANRLEGPLPSHEVLAVVDHAQGQPWLLANLTEQLLEEGALRPAGTPIVPESWPSDATELAWLRVQGLSDVAWTVGGLAAVLAPMARSADLMVLCPAPELLAEGLDALARLGVLTETPHGYRFTHPCYVGLFATAYAPAQQRAFYAQLLEYAEGQDLPLGAEAALEAKLAAARAFSVPSAERRSTPDEASEPPSAGEASPGAVARPEPVRRVLWALRSEQPEAIARYASAAANALLGRGATRTARMLIEEGLVTLSPDDAARGGYLAALATALRREGEPAAACEVFEAAWPLVAPGAPRLELLLAWGAAEAARGAPEAAARHWREAVTAARARGDASALAVAAAGLSDALLASGERAEALAQAETAVGAAREAAPWPRARALGALGALLAGGGRERQAEGVALLQRAAALYEAESDGRGLLEALLRLAEAASERGEPKATAESAERAWGLAEVLGEPEASIRAALLLGECALELNDGARALRLAAEARQAAGERGAASLAAEALALEARARLLLGDAEAAWLLVHQAQAVLAEDGGAEGVRLGLALAEAALATERYPEAVAALMALQGRASASGSGALRARRLYGLGVWAARTGDHARARAEFKAVLAEPNQWLIARATLELGRLAAESGALVEAAGWLEQARRGALALGAEALAAEAARAEQALEGRRSASVDTPGAARERLAALLGELQALLPLLVEPSEGRADLEAALRASEQENAMLRARLAEQQGAQGAVTSAEG